MSATHTFTPTNTVSPSEHLSSIPCNHRLMEPDRKKSPVQVEYGPVLFEYRLMREFVLLQEQNLTNIYVIPSHNSPLKWFGVVFVHDGLYQGAIFRFTVRIPAKFPAASPEIVFNPIPFHPLIHPKTGILKTSLSIPEWDANTNKIWQLVLCAKKVFYSLEADVQLLKDSLTRGRNNSRSDDFNYEAYKLFHEDLEGFQARVIESVQESRVKMYEAPDDADDKNAILFNPWNEQTHESTRRAFVSGRTPDQMDPQSTPAAGLSWIQSSPATQFRSFS